MESGWRERGKHSGREGESPLSVGLMISVNDVNPLVRGVLLTDEETTRSYIHANISTHTHTFTHTHTLTHVHVCIHVSVYVSAHSHAHGHTLAYTLACLRTCIHTLAHAHTYAHTHTQTHTHGAELFLGGSRFISACCLKFFCPLALNTLVHREIQIKTPFMD